MRRITAVALVLALAASGCDFIDEVFSQTVDEIKQEKGLDITSPAQVAGASLFAGEEEQEQLNGAKTVQRILNEQKGDDAYERGDEAKAREHYDKALRWTRSDDKRNQAAIQEKITGTWVDTSANDGSEATMRALEQSYNKLGGLIGAEPNPIARARMLTTQSFAANNLGEFDAACTHAGEALKLDPNNSKAKYMFERTGCRS